MDFTELTSYLNHLSQYEVPSCACLIYSKSQEVYRHYSGYQRISSRSPLKDNTLYRLYSLTKLYTSAAVFSLCEKGMLTLNTPVSDFLPDFADMQVLYTRPNGFAERLPANNAITIRHLLTMQSGLSYAYDNSGAAIRNTREKIEAFRLSKPLYTTQEYAHMLADAPLAFEPGTHFLYGTSYDVLAAIIEKVTKMTYGEYLKASILEPMNLKDTLFKIRSSKDKDRLAGIYKLAEDLSDHMLENNSRIDCVFTEVNERDRQYQAENPFEEGGGGLLATIDDCMKFMLMLQNGGRSTGICPDAIFSGVPSAAGTYAASASSCDIRVLSEASVRMMTCNQLDSTQKLEDYSYQFHKKGEACSYGYGCGVRVKICGTGDQDSPIGEFGWYGMSGNYVLIDPVNELTVVYMQQMIPDKQKKVERIIHPELRKIIYRSISRSKIH